MRTRIYVDGFNLYYGSLKRTPHRWLNPVEMVRRHLQPHHTMDGCKYFTAEVSDRRNNPGQHQRQMTYLRALATLPHTEIIKGYYLTKPAWRPLAHPAPGQPATVQVLLTEEKGSDVNLAVHLLHDAHLDHFDCAIVVSGDSDLVSAVQIVKNSLGKAVGVINPQSRNCVMLQRHATFYMHVRPRLLPQCQFPAQMQDSAGVFCKPPSW